MRDPSNDSPVANATDRRPDGVAAPTHGPARAALSAELHNLVADVEELARQASSLTAGEFASAKAKLSARLGTARDAMSHAGDVVAARARTTLNATNEYVHDQPWKAIGISAALGLLLGFALARR